MFTSGKVFFKETKISGIQTNIPLFLHILENPDFKRGSYSTNLLKQMVNELRSVKL